MSIVSPTHNVLARLFILIVKAGRAFAALPLFIRVVLSGLISVMLAASVFLVVGLVRTHPLFTAQKKAAPAGIDGSSAGSSLAPTNGQTPPQSPTKQPSPTGTNTAAQAQIYNCASSPHDCGYPDNTNTGPANCQSYVERSGTYTVTADGATITCLKLNGTLDVEASNVIVQNSVLTGTSWWGVRLGATKAGATNLKILHSTLQTVAGKGPDNGGYDYGIAPTGTGYIEVGYSDISGYKDGIDVSNGWIHDSYIHGLSQFTGAHSQNIYVYASGPGVKIEHNTLFNDSPADQATAAVYIAPDSGRQNNVTVTRNLLAGGAYVLYGGGPTATNIVITNNAFSTYLYHNSGSYGVIAYWQAPVVNSKTVPNNGNKWDGNVWHDGVNVGQPVTL